MNTTTEISRLTDLIEDLTKEAYESSRARGKEHRLVFAAAEDILVLVKELSDRIRKEDLEKIGSKTARIAPWFIAIASGIASLIHHLYH